MRIAIDAAWACGRRTGTGNYTYHLVRALLDRPSPHEWVLYFRECCPSGNPLYALAEGRAERRILPARSTLWRVLFRLGPAARQDHVDLLLSPAYFLPLRAGSIPRVVTFFDLMVYRLQREWIRPGRILDFLGLRLLLPWAARRADHVVTISDSTRRDFEAIFPGARGRISRIYPGVPGVRLGDMADAARARPYFLYVGVMSPTKNLERLIRAFERLLRAHEADFDLVLVGRESGRYREQVLVPLVRRLDLEARVEFAGFVDDAELSRRYRGARALVYPSLGEGFGYPLVEAMLAGTPVITSTATSCPEVVGDAGLCVDPFSVEDLAEAMHRLAVDDRLHTDLRAAGSRRAARFTVDRMADEYLIVFEKLVRERLSA